MTDTIVDLFGIKRFRSLALNSLRRMNLEAESRHMNKIEITYLSKVLVPFVVGFNPDPIADMFGHRIVIEGKVVRSKISSETMTVVDN